MAEIRNFPILDIFDVSWSVGRWEGEEDARDYNFVLVSFYNEMSKSILE